MSCVSIVTRAGSEIDSVNPQAAVVSVVTKSGRIVDFRKNSPGRVVPGSNAIIGKTLQYIDVDRADVQKMITDKKGKLVTLITAGGSAYEVVYSTEEGGKLHFSAYVPITIPFSDVQQVWIRKSDTGRSVLAGAGLIAAGVVVVGLISVLAFAHLLNAESCPFIYSWDGEEYVLDAEPYGAAISEGLKRTDWVELSNLREVDGEYRVLLTNELDETQYTDELKLVAVDHAPGAKIAPDLAGGFHTFSSPRPPVSAVDQNGRDILPFVAKCDKALWQSALEEKNPDDGGEFRDELVFEFPKPVGAKRVKLLANAWTTQWGSLSAGKFLELYGSSLPEQYEDIDGHGPMYGRILSWMATEELYTLKVWVETPGGWKARAMIMGGAPVITKDKAYAFDVGDIPGETLRIKLRPPVNFWMVNSLAVDYGEEAPVHGTELAAEKAVDHTGRDVRATLAATDGSYLESPNAGERTELVFAAPPIKDGLARTVFVKASGYYKIHLNAMGEPKTGLVERVLGEPGFAARYSFHEYLKWEADIRAEQTAAKRQRY
ncbi:MAG: hypothetical protein NT147_00380 [Candidatus Aminicenantes bacterium]|nr:hypothetical protein [Candidatus Aminicenantes bacterium]